MKLGENSAFATGHRETGHRHRSQRCAGERLRWRCRTTAPCVTVTAVEPASSPLSVSPSPSPSPGPSPHARAGRSLAKVPNAAASVAEVEASRNLRRPMPARATESSCARLSSICPRRTTGVKNLLGGPIRSSNHASWSARGLLLAWRVSSRGSNVDPANRGLDACTRWGCADTGLAPVPEPGQHIVKFGELRQLAHGGAKHPRHGTTAYDARRILRGGGGETSSRSISTILTPSRLSSKHDEDSWWATRALG